MTSDAAFWKIVISNMTPAEVNEQARRSVERARAAQARAKERQAKRAAEKRESERRCSPRRRRHNARGGV